MLLLLFSFRASNENRPLKNGMAERIFHIAMYSSPNSRLLFTLAVLLSLATSSSTQTATPSPASSSSAIPVVGRTRSLDDLQSEIRARLARPELARGQIGIKVVSLTSGKIVFEQNSEKYFMPASNMKNFTVATAIEKLSPDYRFVTSVFAASPLDASGTVKGDLRIFGRGDVSISTAFFPPEPSPSPSPSSAVMPVASPSPAGPAADPDAVYYRGIDILIDKMIAAGVKRVEGSIVADDTYFKGGAIPDGWEWDDLQSYYGAEVSALPLNDNAVDLMVKPGYVGSMCTVKLSPYNPIYRIKNTCSTTASGTPRSLKIEKILGQNIVEISGTLPLGDAGFSNSIAVSRPSELFAALLRKRLIDRGIAVTGQFRVFASNGTAPVETVEIAKLESPPLALIAAKTMKPSQNMYTETLLWTLGEEARKRTGSSSVAVRSTPIPQSSSALGLAEVKSFLASIGVPSDGIVQYDGSGLSRHNLITPAAVVQLYTYMATQSKYSQAWRDSLTIGGVDGTLANRFKGTQAQGNIRGKTGTIDQVSALSGYMTTAGGDQLVMSFVVNGIPVPSNRTRTIDDIVLMLARFDGKLD